MNMEEYKLSHCLEGHTNDIRDLVSFSTHIITASRDESAIVWTDSGTGYKRSRNLLGHSQFVTCVTITPPNTSKMYPEGLIYTGSFDCTIKAYVVDSTDISPVFTLTGHTKAVCSLSSNQNGLVLSGSWDGKAMIWKDNQFVESLEDHEATVWATAFMPDGDTMLTGSADKTMKAWKLGKGHQKTFTGPAFVRALCPISNDEFLSGCSDGKIYRWNVTSGQVSVYAAHDSFIYSLSARSDFKEWASVSEDGTLKIWKNNESVQTIILPIQTPWAVSYLQNNDLAVGGNDGVCRIYTNSPERIASEEQLKALNDAVEQKLAQASISSAQEAIDINTLAGGESLAIPGNHDGHQKIIREGNLIMAYTWNAAQGTWQKLGEVTGAKSKKKLYKGVEYDYVIDVDAEEGKPPLKLPYNVGQDPWTAAQQFIHDNNLSQGYLETVANFIIKNTKQVSSFTPQPAYQDPFTGASRYIPTGERSVSVPTETSQPLMRYVPREYQHQTVINVPKVIQKLQALNVEKELTVSEAALDELASLVLPESCSAKLWASLKEILTIWPPDVNFPLLDLLRVAISKEQCRNCLKDTDWLLQLLARGTTDSSWHEYSTLMAYRALTNMFSSLKDNRRVAELAESALNGFSAKYSTPSSRLQQGASNCALNYSLYLSKVDSAAAQTNDESRKVSLLQCVLDFLRLFDDQAAVDTLIRALICISMDSDVIKILAVQKGVVQVLNSKTVFAETKAMTASLCDSLESLHI